MTHAFPGLSLSLLVLNLAPWGKSKPQNQYVYIDYCVSFLCAKVSTVLVGPDLFLFRTFIVQWAGR